MRSGGLGRRRYACAASATSRATHEGQDKGKYSTPAAASAWLVTSQARKMRDGSGSRMKARPDPAEQRFEFGLLTLMPGDKISLQLRIR